MKSNIANNLAGGQSECLVAYFLFVNRCDITTNFDFFLIVLTRMPNFNTSQWSIELITLAIWAAITALDRKISHGIVSLLAAKLSP